MKPDSTLTFRGISLSESFCSAARRGLRAIEKDIGVIDHARLLVGPANPVRLTLEASFRGHHLFVVREGEEAFSVLTDVLAIVARQMRAVIAGAFGEGERAAS